MHLVTPTACYLTSQHVTDEDIDDVLALSIQEEDEGEEVQVKVNDVAKAMMMSPDRRKTHAQERRRQRSDPQGASSSK